MRAANPSRTGAGAAARASEPGDCVGRGTERRRSQHRAGRAGRQIRVVGPAAAASGGRASLARQCELIGVGSSGVSSHHTGERQRLGDGAVAVSQNVERRIGPGMRVERAGEGLRRPAARPRPGMLLRVPRGHSGEYKTHQWFAVQQH